MPATPEDSDGPPERGDVRADGPDVTDTTGATDVTDTHYAHRETVADLVTAVKLVVGGIALFVTALVGGALGRGGGQVALFLFVGGAALVAFGYWSLPDVEREDDGE